MAKTPQDPRQSPARLSAAIDTMGRYLPFAMTLFSWIGAEVELRLFRFGAAGPDWSAGDWMFVERISNGTKMPPTIRVSTSTEIHQQIERILAAPLSSADTRRCDALKQMLAVSKSPPDPKFVGSEKIISF